MAAEQRELAMAKRHVKTTEALSKGSKQLPPLIEGDTVSIQDQSGNTPKRWSKTGKVLEALGNDSYLIKVDGTQRVTKRNRQFLHRLEIFHADTKTLSIPVWTPPAPTLSTQADTTEFIDPVDGDADRANAPEPDLTGQTTRPAQQIPPTPTFPPRSCPRCPSGPTCVLPSAPAPR